jgi:hypothetical protein
LFHCSLASRAISGTPFPHQFGVSTPGGCETIPFGIRTLLNLHPNWVMTQVDVKNAFYNVSQVVILKKLQDVRGPW